MLHIRRVLFPTDYSEAAEQAFVHAAHLAAAHDAELHALHVTSEEPRGGRRQVPEHHIDAAAQLGLPTERAAGPLSPEKITQREIQADSAAEGILSYAEEHGIDLIVMGTHGRQAIERMLIGSVAERVVREAPCPVLTVRAGGDLNVRRILVPIDFSDRSKAAIAVAEALADLYDANIELFFVIDEADLPIPGAPVLGPVHVAPDVVEARFRKLMNDLVKEYQDGRSLTGTVHVGSPASDIIDHAAEHADLIVMSTHGRRGVQRFFLGSVAEKVIRRAPCPVFTVKSFGRQSGNGS
jgi:nucleotide-binding universal stress UspA family protein